MARELTEAEKKVKDYLDKNNPCALCGTMEWIPVKSEKHWVCTACGNMIKYENGKVVSQ